MSLDQKGYANPEIRERERFEFLYKVILWLRLLVECKLALMLNKI